MILKQIFKKVGVFVHTLFWGAITYIIAYELCLRKIPEKIPETWRFGAIFEELALAVIASCIFYVLVVVLEKIHNEVRANEYIARKISEIISDARFFLDALRKATKTTSSEWPPNPSEIMHICQTVVPNSKAKLIISTPSISKIATWSEYFIMILGNSESCINKIWLHMPFLDTKFIVLIGKIENSNFFKYVRTLQFAGVPPISFDKIWKDLHNYFQIISEIEQYAFANFKKYRENLKVVCGRD